MASIHHDIGYMYKENNEPEVAISQFLTALQYINNNDSSYLSKKIEILQKLSKCYEATGNKTKFLETREKAHALLELKSNKDIKVLEKEIEKKDQNLLNTEKNNIFNKTSLIFIIIITLIGVIIFTYSYINNKRKYTELRKKLELINNSETHISLISEMPSLDEDNNDIQMDESVNNLDENIVIENNIASQKTTERILKELEKFEQKEAYLACNFTISHLAIQLDTNTKTLSQIIKVHKKQNFNAYINQLRILHFSKKVEQDEEFRKYKLSYIAEYLGYSSASAFSNSFKSITGILPSTYLKKLKF